MSPSGTECEALSLRNFSQKVDQTKVSILKNDTNLNVVKAQGTQVVHLNSLESRK